MKWRRRSRSSRLPGSRFNQIYLTNGCVLDSYQMFTKKPVKSLADFKGQKIAGAGVNLRYLQGLGAAGVPGSLVSFYNKLKTGVVSGAMLWPEAVVRLQDRRSGAAHAESRPRRCLLKSDQRKRRFLEEAARRSSAGT